MKVNYAWRMAIALGAAVSVVTGCSSGDAAAVKEEGFAGTTELQTGTVGVLNVLGSSENQMHWENTATDALEKVGWTPNVTDGKGDPSVWNQALSTFVQQQVDGILIIGGVETAAIATQLKAAQAADIPVIAVAIGSPDPERLLDANYAAPDGEFGTIMAEHMKETLPPGVPWVALTISASEGGNAPNLTALPILEAGGHPRVGTVDLNLAGDLPGQASKGATDLLRANPDAAMLFSCCDFTATQTIPALAESGHDTVINALRYDNLSTLDMIRQGKPVVTVGTNSDSAVLTGVDQLLAHKASGTEIDPAAFDGKAEFTVIDRSNVPESGFYYSPDDQIAAFVDQWKAEYK